MRAKKREIHKININQKHQTSQLTYEVWGKQVVASGARVGSGRRESHTTREVEEEMKTR